MMLGSFRVESKKKQFQLKISAEQYWRFIIGIHMLDGFIGVA
jgi:hypothetical protein